MADEIIYRIHPSIGVARLGDAKGADDFLIGPEFPEQRPAERRKREKKVLRQAARFRVFAYHQEGDELVLDGEVLPGEGDVVEVRWKCHLANRKAAFHQFDGLKGERGKYHDGADISPLPLRNAGPAADWEIDPGAKSIAGKSANPVRFDVAGGGHWPKNAAGTPVIDYLGELRTDDAGRLLVLGGHGTSASSNSPPAEMLSYANNPTWLDDISDGPVTAEVVIQRGAEQLVVPVGEDGAAWCLVGPPDFAPEVTSVVTLYDLLVDMAARKLDLPKERVYAAELAWLRALNAELRGGGTNLTQFKPEYRRDVFPVLERALQYRWVHAPAANAHADRLSDPELANPKPAAADVRVAVFDRLREPAAPFNPKHTMPRLLGDEPYADFAAAPHRRRLALTRTQYAVLERWKDGEFLAPTGAAPIPGRFREPETKEITPWGLDRAALEACVGGAFYPGIEASWQMRHDDLFIAPFRIRHGAASTFIGEDTETVRAGHFSRQMALPWQADFMDCKIEKGTNTPELKGEWGWWPSQRPDNVPKHGASMPEWVRGSDQSHEWMVANWAKLGFVMRVGVSDEFSETERDSSLPL